jgi:heme-degrading monooxygenase HmoA
MAAFNVVRFKVKPGREQGFVEAHRRMRPAFKGFKDGNLIRTGDQTFCLVGEWRSFKSIEAARPQMIEMLNQVRDMLEDLGAGLGVTDPVSGEAVAKLAASKPAKKSATSRSSPGNRAKKVAGKKAKVVGKRGAKTAKKRR